MGGAGARTQGLVHPSKVLNHRTTSSALHMVVCGDVCAALLTGQCKSRLKYLKARDRNREEIVVRPDIAGWLTNYIPHTPHAVSQGNTGNNLGSFYFSPLSSLVAMLSPHSHLVSGLP